MGGVPFTAGCRKCDDSMPILDDSIHHKDGSVCAVMARNFAILERKAMGPLGRYNPAKDKYLNELPVA